jgi:hypothetical protein
MGLVMKMRKLLAMLDPENLPTSITVGVAIVIIALRVPGWLTDSQVLAGLVAVLGAVALANRLERASLQRLLQSPTVPDLIQLRSSDSYTRFQDYVSGAEELFVVGSSLIAFTTLYRFDIADLVRAGCRLKVLLLDPDGFGLDVAAGWAMCPKNSFKAEIHNSLDHLNWIAEAGEERVEIRLTKIAAPLSGLMVDPDKINGRMRVDFILAKCNPQLRPHVELTVKNNEKWYNIFKGGFDGFWEQGVRWSPKEDGKRSVKSVCEMLESDRDKQ